MKCLALVTVLMVLSSCQSTRRAKLEENVRHYFLSLRRDDQNAIVSFVHPDKQQEFYENIQKLSGLYLSHVEVETVFPDEALESAVVSAKFEFFSEGGSLVQSEKRKFLWKYNAEAKTWLLEEPQPFGSALLIQNP